MLLCWVCGVVAARFEGVCYASAPLPGDAPAVALQLLHNNAPNAEDNMGDVTAPSDGHTWQDVDVECFIYH